MSEEGDYEELLNLPRPTLTHREIAILWGHDDNDLAIAGGYREAGEVLARHWVSNGPNDGLVLPILYLYRHSVELSLKWLIRVAARCAIRDGYAGQENLTPAKVEEKITRTHNIKDLADRLERYMGFLRLPGPDNRIDQVSWKRLRWLDSEDETGEAFRYAMIGKGISSRPARKHDYDDPTYNPNFNFYEPANELHKLAHLLLYGYSTYLDEYERAQLEQNV